MLVYQRVENHSGEENSFRATFCFLCRNDAAQIGQWDNGNQQHDEIWKVKYYFLER